MSRESRTGWRQVPAPKILAVLGGDIRAYAKDLDDGTHLSVFVGPEPGVGWHLSISHRTAQKEPGRYPTWDEISAARYEFCPAHLTMAMLLPPKEEFVNVHPTTFHLYQITNDVLGGPS